MAHNYVYCNLQGRHLVAAVSGAWRNDPPRHVVRWAGGTALCASLGILYMARLASTPDLAAGRWPRLRSRGKKEEQ